MKNRTEQKALDLNIAYIGGGSRGWAWGFMMDLAMDEQMCGTVRLYDIAIGTTPVQELAVENPGGSVIFRDLDSSALYYIEIELPETAPSRASVTLRISR